MAERLRQATGPCEASRARRLSGNPCPQPMGMDEDGDAVRPRSLREVRRAAQMCLEGTTQTPNGGVGGESVD